MRSFSLVVIFLFLSSSLGLSTIAVANDIESVMMRFNEVVNELEAQESQTGGLLSSSSIESLNLPLKALNAGRYMGAWSVIGGVLYGLAWLSDDQLLSASDSLMGCERSEILSAQCSHSQILSLVAVVGTGVGLIELAKKYELPQQVVSLSGNLAHDAVLQGVRWWIQRDRGEPSLIKTELDELVTALIERHKEVNKLNQEKRNGVLLGAAKLGRIDLMRAILKDEIPAEQEAKRQIENLGDCVICLSELNGDAPIVIRGCGHAMCVSCLHRWYAVNLSHSCPTCRDLERDQLDGLEKMVSLLLHEKSSLKPSWVSGEISSL